MIILENEEKEIIKFLWSQEIYDIFYNNKTLIKDIIEKINNTKMPNKNIIKKNTKIFTKKIIKVIKKIKIKYYKKITNKKFNNNLILVEGSNGVGKSTFISIIIKMLNCKEILICDYKNDVQTIINKKANINKIKFINQNINKEDIFENKFNLMFFENNNFLENNLKEEAIKKSNKIILLIEPNLLGIKKAKEILEKYINEKNISKNKIKIIFNKTTPFSISDLILSQLFSDFEVIGKIKLNYKYDLAINCNFNQIDKEIKKEYLKIIKKIGG